MKPPRLQWRPVARGSETPFASLCTRWNAQRFVSAMTMGGILANINRGGWGFCQIADEMPVFGRKNTLFVRATYHFISRLMGGNCFAGNHTHKE
ncbi:hypothetical protein [Chitinibacter sp. GC72]|uniref:hypothetical protein n=1 Tax=Chitinibacter sp. GC72 TaxID=1526917 RepID=UPI0018E052E0|nr:hypothetical protein [Chitinibacter sp. GC72]